MKKLMLSILSLLLLSSHCHAWDDNDPCAWTTADVFLESGIFALAGAATLQTYSMMENGERLSEGAYRSDIGEVTGYTAGAVIGHAVVTHFLPQPYRRYWQYMGLGAAGGYVGFVFSHPME